MNRAIINRSRQGQAMIEALLVVVVLVGLFCFFFDFTYGVVAKLLLTHGSARAARAATVGFNEFHRAKALNIATLPVAGEQWAPTSSTGTSTAYIRTYLQSLDWTEARGILDYERWHTLHHTARRQSSTVTLSASFDIPECLPDQLGRLFGISSRNAVQDADGTYWRHVQSQWEIEDHSHYYLKEGDR